MNDKLFIPNKIRVGYQKRNDTYTGKLAYVIYIDNKGVVRKEQSWTGWIDKNIKVDDFTNEPVNGFVLNRDVGGTQRSWSWNARREKVRVFDPRGFEFEITVENLLFILQECSSIKGKGLEGELVYSWSGKELVLLPVDSKEYKNSVSFTSLQSKQVQLKEIKEGYIYVNKKQEELMYLGKFDYWHEFYGYDKNEYPTHPPKKHFFIKVNEFNKLDGNIYNYVIMSNSSIKNIATKIEAETPHPEFARQFEVLKKSILITKPIRIFLSDKPLELSNNLYYRTVGTYRNGQILYGRVSNYSNNNIYTFIKYGYITLLNNGFIKYDNDSNHYNENISEEQLTSHFNDIMIEYENGYITKQM